MLGEKIQSLSEQQAKMKLASLVGSIYSVATTQEEQREFAISQLLENAGEFLTVGQIDFITFNAK